MQTKIFRDLSPALDRDHEYSSKTTAHKKLKLFGFELDINISLNERMESNDESTNSSTTTPFEGKEISKNPMLRCTYCFKKFSNSQALGGHQNAHKKERMKKTRGKIQGNKANNTSYYYPNKDSSNISFVYDPSSYKESQVSFSRDQNFRLFYESKMTVPCDMGVFTLTHID